MATWYAKPTTSHNSTRNGTSEATAFGGWAEILWASMAAGDTLYLLGDFRSATTLVIGAHNGTANAPLIIRGDGVPAGSITITVAGQTITPKSFTTIIGTTFTVASRGIVTASSLTYFSLQNCIFNGGTNSIFVLGATTGNNHTDIYIDSCSFTAGGDNAATGGGAAITWFSSIAASVTTVTRLTINNCTFNYCNVFGTSRGVLSFRTEEDVDASSIMTDVVVTNNTFTNCRGYTIEAVDGHSFGAASPQYGLWKGFKFTGNLIENQTVDDTRVLGGGCAAFGFDKSPTASFGPNTIASNNMRNIEGQCGGINVGYGTYQITDNKIVNVGTYSIDGCGILLDDGVKFTIATRNYIKNLPGHKVNTNSGAGFMFLNTESSLVYGNVVEDCKYGLYFGSVLPGSYTWAFNNTFVNCADAGIIMGSVPDRTATKALNNVFIGTNQGTNYSVKVTGGSAWSNEDYNYFYNFATAPLNHTIGASSSTNNPLLYINLIPKLTSPVKETGTFVRNTTDQLKNLYHNPPSIGAYEYIPVRGMR